MMQENKNKIKYTIRYKEIALKQKLIHRYEQQLIQNIKSSIKYRLNKNDLNEVKIFFRQKIGYIITTPQISQTIESVLDKTFGIAWWGKIYEYDFSNRININSLAEYIKNLIETIPNIKLTVKRHNKKYPETSLDIFIKLANTLRLQNINIDKKSKYEIIVIIKDNYLEITLKQPGIGGLPVATSGNAMIMLSGGFDSPVATYLLAKRGLSVNCLHFYPENEKNSNKIPRIGSKLKAYIPYIRLFGYPAVKIQAIIKENKLQNKVLLFKFGMAYITYLFTQHRFYKKDFAIATGDNLSQVASQTLNNLNSIDIALFRNGKISSAILRPLLTYDKSEIIMLARKLNLYNDIIHPYTDSCGAVANKKNRKTRNNQELFLEETQILINNLTFNSTDIIEYKV